MSLINVCAEKDISFKSELTDADVLTDYAVEIRYPDDWYEPTFEESREAIEIVHHVKKFVLKKIRNDE